MGLEFFGRREVKYRKEMELEVPQTLSELFLALTPHGFVWQMR